MIYRQKETGPGEDPVGAVDPLFSVAGRRVLVAGGASGLGRALAEAFAERGARCLVADIEEAAAVEMSLRR